VHSAPHHGPSEGWARPKRQGARITKDWPAKPKAIPTVPRDVPRRDAFSDRHPSVYLPGGEHTIQKSNGIELDSRTWLLIQIVFIRLRGCLPLQSLPRFGVRILMLPTAVKQHGKGRHTSPAHPAPKFVRWKAYGLITVRGFLKIPRNFSPTH